jgi:hypothetical protein
MDGVGTRILGLDPPRILHVDGNLVVTGSLTVSGQTSIKTDDLLKQIQKQDEIIQCLRDTLHQQQAMLDQLWNAPGMPGYIQAEGSFLSLQAAANEAPNRTHPRRDRISNS